MNVSSGLVAAAFITAIIAAIGWLGAYLKVARYQHAYKEQKRETAQLRHRMDRMMDGAEKNRSKLQEKTKALWDVGKLLNDINNPVGTLKRIYKVLEQEDMAMVKDSPLAFVDENGAPSYKNPKDDKEVFQRIKDGMGGGGE